MLHSVCRFSLTLCLLLATSFASAADLDWPQWRGPNRTDISTEKDLLQKWPADGPKLLWSFDNAGLGYSSFAVVGEQLFTLGSRDNTEQIICLNSVTGQELWAAEIGEELQNGWGGGPRGTPTVDGDRVYALGGQGNLICADRSNGKVLWSKSMQSLGGKKPNWGYTESVLIDGDRVVCTPGGDQGTMACLDKNSGEVIWQSKNITDKAQYASIIPTRINGDHQYVQLTQNTLFGIKAADGSLLWSSPWPPGRTAVIPTPIVKNNYVYITSGYGAGCKLVKINPDYSTEDVYQNTEMKNHHGGVLLYEGNIYGHSDAGWICQDFMTGETKWRERRNLQKGSVTFADGMLYCLEEKSGKVALVEATPEEYREHGRFSLPKSSEIRSPKGKVWSHPVVVNGKLYLRDQEFVFCYDVSAK